MKIISVLTALVLIMVIVAGCGTPAYQYVDEEATDYLILNMEIPDKNEIGSRYEWNVTFASVEEMIQDLKTGNFTEDELYELSRMVKDDEGRTILPDLDNLYEPVFPGEADLLMVRLVGGKRYEYQYEDFSFVMLKEVWYNDLLETFSFDSAPVLRPGDTNDHRWDITDGSYYYYIIQTDTKTMYVREMIYLSEEQDIVPVRIEVYFEFEDNLYVEVVFPQPAELPTIEWLSSFAMKPYEG